MIRSALATLTVSLSVAVGFGQAANQNGSPTTAPTATAQSAKRKHHATSAAATPILQPSAPPLPKVPPRLPSTSPTAIVPLVPVYPSAMYSPPTPRKVSVEPNVEFVPTSDIVVRDMHLRPLYTSTIHVGEAVTSLVVGAPTLFEVEHKDTEPYLIFVKPSTHQAADSNLLIALASGETISIHLISPGDVGSPDPTDFVVDFRGRKSMFESAAVVLGTPGSNSVGGPAGNVRAVAANNHSGSGPEAPAADSASLPMNAESALSREMMVGDPHWVTVPELTKLIKENAKAPNSIAIAIGEIRQEGDNMVVSFAVLNASQHWVEIMPPQIELTNPLLKKKDAKKQGSFAEPIPSAEYKMDNPKLSPGARVDGSITFTKPATKIARESLLLHIATSASIDTPVYYPLPFVAPSSEETLAQQGEANARN
jgi:hypothetical protein